MCVTLIGGMDRLQKDYEAIALKIGHDLKCVTRNEKNFVEKLGKPDLLIVFTNKISHEARRKALLHARQNNIPIQMLHSCGLSSLSRCLLNAGA